MSDFVKKDSKGSLPYYTKKSMKPYVFAEALSCRKKL